MDMNQHKARLVVHDGDQTQTVQIEPLPFTIGRLPDRSLSLPHSQVSRQHAIIHLGADGFSIQDLGSRHGTRVNGERRDLARLKSGDRIQLGTSSVVLLFVDSLDETSSRVLMSRISGDAGGSELEKLSLFLQAAQCLNTTRGLNDVLGKMVEYTLRLTGAERGFVFLGDSPSSLLLECGLTKEGVPLTDDSKISRSIVRDAAVSGQEYFVGDVSGEGRPLGRESMAVHELMSVIAIPLRGRNSDQLLGLLYLDSRSRTSTLNRVSREILHEIATEAANLVENARLVHAQREADLLRNELEIASSIQRSIIPAELPHFPYAKVTAKTIPCTAVGGDFYDVIPVKDGFVAIVADVSGKGMSAALLGAIIQGMMYVQIMNGASIVDTVSAINTFLCSRVSGQKYVTLVALHYQEGGRVELVNGGHVLPVVIGEDQRAEVLPDGDIPVGLFRDVVFHSFSLDLPRGARVVLMSDGVTEAENPENAQFSSTEMTQDMAGNEPIYDVFASMHKFCVGAQPHDDCTMLVIDRII
jgi:serine phosphatase RsbU (regulator of sigma subunit)